MIKLLLTYNDEFMSIMLLSKMMEGLTSWVPDLHGSRGQIDGKARGKGEGSGSEHTPREEHDEHTQNSHDTRPIAPERWPPVR